MNYRRIFHLSPEQLKDCDLQDVLMDLEMLSLEEEFNKPADNKSVD